MPDGDSICIRSVQRITYGILAILARTLTGQLHQWGYTRFLIPILIAIEVCQGVRTPRGSFG